MSAPHLTIRDVTSSCICTSGLALAEQEHPHLKSVLAAAQEPS